MRYIDRLTTWLATEPYRLVLWHLGAVAALVVIAIAAHCTPAQRAELGAEGLALAGKEAGCVLQSIVEGGLDDPKQIIDKCGKVTIQNVADVTQGWLDQVTSTDGGHPAAVSPVQIRIALAHDRAVTALDGGSK